MTDLSSLMDRSFSFFDLKGAGFASRMGSVKPLLAALCLILTGLSSCETIHFYSQGIKGQTEILAKKQSVAKLLEDPATPPKLRKQFVFTQSIREFARKEFHLPAKNAYDSYTDLKRPHVVWVVFAAPEFSVEPHTWRYPFLGKLEYRGYFTEKDARALADQLKKKGLDVVTGGVDAYSSLGFFNDPLLNTFIFDPELDLAELLFHELTHRRLFVAGDTDFNEAFATATSQICMVRWLKATGRTKDLQSYEVRLRQEKLFADEVLKTRAALAKLYGQNLPPEEMRKRKAILLKRLSARIQSMPELASAKGFKAWARQPLNNARLNTIHSYQAMIPQFHELLKKCNGDLELYFKEAKKLKQ